MAGERGEIQLAVSQFVLQETHTNLSKKATKGLDMLSHYSSLEMFILAQPEQAEVDQISTFIQPKDAPIVAAAIACGASRIATFDKKHLLIAAAEIERRWGIQTLLPGQILKAR